MKKLLLLSALIIFMVMGCTSSGAFISANQTVVNLEQRNYSLRATNVMGQAESGYVLGISYSSGLLANTIAIARVDGTDMLYADAIQNLWENYEKQNSPVEGQALALSNVRYDTDIWNFILYTKVKLTVRADIVEFE